MKHLMLIESPNKIKTIKKYLGSGDIEVMATIGHIRELDEHSYDRLGFDLKTYEMKWRNDSKKKTKEGTYDVIEKINNYANKSEKIYLSTDNDREGEAIAWHIYSILSDKNKKKCCRIVFNEITKKAIEESFLHPRDLDLYKINSYLARKLLDRGLGFKLSNFVNKTMGAESAGRVQSIALKFLKDRNEEIQAFVPKHWFNIDVVLKNDLPIILKKVNPSLKVNIAEDVNNGNVNFATEEDAKKVIDSLDSSYVLASIGAPKQEKQNPGKALKTSTLQQAAINKIGISSSMVESIAQKLYEGVVIDDEPVALITYPRTDREDLSESFVKEAKKFIKEVYSEKYVSSGTVKNVKKEKIVQGAHEGIRPTDLYVTPESLEGKLPQKELDIYKLIWTYAMSSLMSAALYEDVLYSFENNKNVFTANFRTELFDGFKILFRKYFPKSKEEVSFPVGLKKGEKYEGKKKESRRVDKKPPALYTESTLIKALEDKDIGRPSTYSHIVNIVLKRSYAQKDSGKLAITPLGLQVSEVLQKYFPTIMKYEYTTNMEKELDDISENRREWKAFLDSVFSVFFKELEAANLESSKSRLTGEKCQECGSDLIYRFSKKTKQKFISCSSYPRCKYVKYLEENVEQIDELCPDCNHSLLKRKNKRGEWFVGCSNYPKCKYIKRDKAEVETLDKECPTCNHPLLKRKNKRGEWFVGCSNYPKCKYIEGGRERKEEKLEERCPECESNLIQKVGRFGKPFISCSQYPSCKYWRKVKKDKN